MGYAHQRLTWLIKRNARKLDIAKKSAKQCSYRDTHNRGDNAANTHQRRSFGALRGSSMPIVAQPMSAPCIVEVAVRIACGMCRTDNGCRLNLPVD